MDFLIELLVSLLWEFFGQLLAELTFELGLASTRHAVGKTAPNPFLASAGCLILGALAGGIMLAAVPHRILPTPPVPGLSLLIAPLLNGLAMKSFGDWRRARGRPTTFLATFAGGAWFALAMAAVRLAILLHAGA